MVSCTDPRDREDFGSGYQECQPWKRRTRRKCRAMGNLRPDLSNLGVNNFDDRVGSMRECRRVMKVGGERGADDEPAGPHAGILSRPSTECCRNAPMWRRAGYCVEHVAHRATVERGSSAAGGRMVFRETSRRGKTGYMRFAKRQRGYSITISSN